MVDVVLAHLDTAEHWKVGVSALVGVPAVLLGVVFGLGERVVYLLERNR